MEPVIICAALLGRRHKTPIAIKPSAPAAIFAVSDRPRNLWASIKSRVASSGSVCLVRVVLLICVRPIFDFNLRNIITNKMFQVGAVCTHGLVVTD